MRHRARSLALLAVPLAAFAIAPVGASCAAPSLSIDGAPSILKVGQTITIRTEGGWGDFPCDDTGGGSMFGCSSDDPGDEVGGEPDQDIEIRFYGPLTPKQERQLTRYAHRSSLDNYQVLGTVDSNADGYFEVEVQIPAVEPGRYVIDTPLGYDDAYAVTVRQESPQVGTRSSSGGPPRAVVLRKALADGRIDRAEAIRLAVLRREVAPRYASARRERLSGRSVWNVAVDDPGCWYLVTIDAKTGRTLVGTDDCG